MAVPSEVKGGTQNLFILHALAVEVFVSVPGIAPLDLTGDVIKHVPSP